MDFVAVLDQVIALLRQRGRVAYRTLKRQFQLDDEALADLKVELIKSQRLAADEDGEVLVWIGEAASPPAPATVALTPAPLGYTPPYLAEKILTSRRALEGERKQVTVLFADLKASTELIADLDPEAAQQLLDPALHAMMDAVHQYEGTVNQVLGDGIMALFGAPLAHEDHAVRACYAGLALQAAMRRYAEEVRRSHGLEMQARVEQALQALAHLPEPGDTRVLALDLRLALGSPLNALGEFGRRRALLGEAEALARGLGDRARLGRVLAAMARVLRLTGDLDGAIATGQQALALAAALGESALQGEASHTLGQAYHAIGDFGRAAELLRRNVAATERESGMRRTDFGIRSQAWLAQTLSALGAFAEGRRHGEEAVRLATLAGRSDLPSVARACLGLLYLAQGDLEHAMRVFEPGLALGRASGDRNWLRTIVGGLGYAYALQGRLAEGRTLLEEAVSDSLSTGGACRAVHWAWLSEGCRLGGHGAEAWQHARQALDLAQQQKDRGEEALALHQLGVVHAHADPPDVVQAEASYRQALALAEELGMRPLQAHCHRGLGTLYATTGQREQARAALCNGHRDVSCHGHDVLAPRDRGGAGAGEGTMIVGALSGLIVLLFAQCDPLVERGRCPRVDRKAQGFVTQFPMRVQVPPFRCRSDSISPRPATGPQGTEAGRNGGPWKPSSGYPV